MLNIAPYMEALCVMVESGKLRYGNLAGVFLNTLSDNNIVDILKVAEMVCEVEPGSSSSQNELENGYYFIEMAFILTSLELGVVMKALHEYTDEQRNDVANHFIDRLCLEYARRKKYIEVLGPLPITKDFYYTITSEFYKYRDEVCSKHSCSFIDKRLGLQIIILEAMKHDYVNRMRTQNVKLSVLETFVNAVRINRR